MPSIKELRRRSQKARERRGKDRRTRVEIRAEAKARVSAKRAHRVRYGTHGIQTSEGLQITFGYWDANRKFHTMKPADYVKKYKEIAGHPPVHELLLQAEGISKADRDYMADKLGVQAAIVKGAREMVDREGDVIEGGVPVKTKAAKKTAAKKGKKR